jgi:RHS repeat-associated protein
MAQHNKPAANGEGQKVSSAPSISLPKGGGAIRGIGEKFAANPVSGTGSMSVPIASSPGRSGFGPQLSLSYDSGAGNGPFGFGWALGLPQVTRKTDKGLPRYHDAEESDVFILSGAEDLVPILVEKNGKWVPETLPDRAIGADTYTVRRYRPRIEGLFARIERWTRADGDVHWRSISKDNILCLYGKDSSSRIADPADSLRAFTWLICETRDDKGNAILYEYKPEDGIGVDLTLAHERNRGDRNDSRRAANRYLKRIRYGNRAPLLDNSGNRPRALSAAQLQNAGWMFEVVFDYGEHAAEVPTPGDAGPWTYRSDPFSSCRAGFEVRTGRLCRRVLMFHHFAGEPGVGVDCLVRSTDFTYSPRLAPASARNPVYSFLLSVTQTGYRRDNGGYRKRSLPPLECEYTQPIVQDSVREVDAASLENLPIGVEGATYQWTDLHGEGIPGILTEQAGAWFYKRNVSPISERPVEFSPLERVVAKPNLALAGGRAQLMDLAGDGQPDLVILDGPMPGLYEHDEAEGWQPFRAFTSRLNREMRDPNLKFIDLDGDGHADVLISEDNAFVWHPSLAEEGFGPARRVAQALDEEKGPRLVFSDGAQSVYLADLNGDGLTDLVRIRNGEVCYWPNLGYGRFGAKVTMDHAPQLDNPDQFDHKRVRLADIDGSGTADIVYLHRDGVRLYFNQSGNTWSAPQALGIFPRADDLVSIFPTDLLGNGTACLVWSSPLPGDARRQMRYVDLMGGQKPHLLIKAVNNLGAETVVQYAPSTKFYLRDKLDGKPWITRLPFPVHVVERVETYDHIGRNRFVTRYAYHHGYFDGEEREFRGFGMLEQFDTEESRTLAHSGAFPDATNLDKASHVPPVLTKTWFHTGVYLGRNRVSNFFAGLLDDGDVGEYYPGLRSGDAAADAAAKALLLDDTVLPAGWTLDEEREACRALKGSMLRREVYALDGTDKQRHPYTVTEQDFTIARLQPKAGNRHGVFSVHPREAISYHYERNPTDPRIQHATTLEVNAYGNVLKGAAIGYGRRQPDLSLSLQVDRDKQTRTLITYTENRVTNPIDDVAVDPDNYRAPLPCENRSFELTGYPPTGAAGRFQSSDFVQAAGNGLAHVFDAEIDYEDLPTNGKQRRLLEHVRTLYRKSDLTDLLPLGTVEPLALPGESYKAAFTPGLAQQIYLDSGKVTPIELEDILANEGGYVHSEGDANWWVPSGRVFFSPGATDTPAQELLHARRHFFLPRRFRDPFHTTAVSTESSVSYDANDLLIVETRDALDNRITVGERDEAGNLTAPGNDYRVLQPRLMMDSNRNRTAAAFDALGMVAGTAVMGKPLPAPVEGDSLDGFEADLTEAVLLEHLANPLTDPQSILRRATTRLVHDLFAYQRTKGLPNPQPAVVHTLTRETHDSDPIPAGGLRMQHSFSYSDGLGREIQKKIRAEPGPVVAGGPLVSPRWVGSGWTLFNNKGKPVRQYEPFFSATHGFEFGLQVGVSSVLFYDPVERVIATLNPDNTYQKVVFDPWQQTTWDVNDTVLGDPRTDADIKGFTASYFADLPASPAAPWQTWRAQRQGNELGTAERSAALKAAAHADTPTTAHFDSLGRPFLTLAHNGLNPDTTPVRFATRVDLDLEGNQRAVRDATAQAGEPQGRIVVRYAHDLLGNRIHQLGMEAGGRWMLNDVDGKPIRAWGDRGHVLRTVYDPLRRLLRSFVTGADPVDPNRELLTERLVYGEQQPQGELRNLRGKLYLHFDQAGLAAYEAHDFKGNPLRASRRIAKEYQQAIDWSAVDAAVPGPATVELDPVALEVALASRLEVDSYASRTTYDALNRPVTLTTPHTSAMQPSVIRSGYNEANLLERVDANLRGAAANGQPVWTPFVTGIDYDAKGQRQRIDYGNGASTFHDYDPLTFRPRHLYTRRGAGFDEDCENPQPPPPTIAAPDVPPPGMPCGLQNLHYTYDPVGNITHVRDGAQQTIYFRNKRVEPSTEYTYDALYRLVEAAGREHLGQIGGVPVTHSHSDAPRVGIDWAANDGKAMGAYVERYLYDAVGNLLELQHRGSDPVHAGWTRTYAYGETSLIEDGTAGSALKTSNRLSSTTVGNNNPPVERYVHDAHGNMTRMPHLGGAHPAPNMHWDYRDQLRRTDLGGGGTAYYVYDAGGQRVRKVIEKAANLIEERIYLGGFEIFRRRQGAQRLERETLHVMDDKQRIALVETRTADTTGTDPAPAQLIRYQFGNHLGSCSLELDEQAQIISYEEYTSYGSTSYQAVRSQTESPKRYRYTGKERDEESGLSYHRARYYGPWLGRWTACDPKGIAPGINVYRYAANRPNNFVDPDGTQEKDPKAPTTAAYGQLSPLGKAGVTTTTHEDVKSEAAKYTASSMEFGFTDIAAWKSDPEYLMKFKAQFVYENRQLIKAAAAKYDLPEELVAGVAFVEIGGKDPIKPAVYWARSWIPGTEDKDKTSLGQQATQVRRAAESLGYDPKTLTDAQRTEIVKSLKDPSQSIFIAAKHLSDLRNIDAPGKAGKDLTTDDVKVIGARYNQGPDKSLADVKKDLSYGQSITNRWTQLGRLLTTAPPKLEYSPVENNVVKPVNRWFGGLEWEIKRMYGVPF